MSKYYLFQDKKKCIGCQSCEVNCKSNKMLPRGPKLCQIITIGPKFIDGAPKASYVFIPCFHCENPWCVAVCPTGAMKKRHEDGIVHIDESLCVGCKTCITACPWGAPQWNNEKGKAVKCDYCMDRLDKGLKPACVTVCTTHCLEFVPGEQAPQVRRERHAATVAAIE